MSYEVFGDDDPPDYEHLFEAGWWDGDQTKLVKDAISDLVAEPIYEGGKKENGVSVRFLARITLLRHYAGELPSGPLVDEAEVLVAAPLPPSQKVEP